jgi:hypothetical protein
MNETIRVHSKCNVAASIDFIIAHFFYHIVGSNQVDGAQQLQVFQNNSTLRISPRR